MGRSLGRVAGVVVAGALATLFAAPAALAQTDTTTAPSTTETSTSETTTTTAPSTSETTAPSTPVTSSSSSQAPGGEVKTTDKPQAKVQPEIKGDTQEPPKDDDGYQDAVGHGYIGLSGEGVLVVACASGKVGGILSQNLSVTAGPDQDEADGRYWNYAVTVVTPPSGATARFAFTCDGVEGIGIVDFEQEQPPATSTSSEPTTSSSVPSSSSAPVTTATSSAPGNAAPKAQVKVAPKGGVETGFGGTA
ncbi:hypothetical protein [Amycolatopsis sp. NPDC004378]